MARMPRVFIVRKANDLIGAIYNLTVEENRLINYLIAQVRNEDQEFKPYTLSVTEFCKYTQISQENIYGRFMEVSKGLLTKPMLIYQGEKRIMLNWLSEAIYHSGEGKMTMILSPTLKPYLLEINKNFTMFKLDNVIKLRSHYTFRFYELLKQYEKIGKRTFHLDQLKEILYLSDKYKDYFNFKKYVLLTAQRELLKKCDIRFEFTPIKTSHRVEKIEFLIFQNLSEAKDVHTDGTGGTGAPPPLPKAQDRPAPPQQKPAPAPPDLKELLFFIDEPLSAKKLLDIYDAAGGNIDLIRQRYYDIVYGISNIKDITGTLIWALKNLETKFDKTPGISRIAPNEPGRTRFSNFPERNNDFNEFERLELEQFKEKVKSLS